jgi:hypothetical protein
LIGQIERGVIARDHNFIHIKGEFMVALRRELLIKPKAENKKVKELYAYDKDKRLIAYISDWERDTDMVERANLEIWYDMKTGLIYVHDPHTQQLYWCLLQEVESTEKQWKDLVPLVKFSTENPRNKSLID